MSRIFLFKCQKSFQISAIYLLVILVFFMKGKNVNIAEGTKFIVEVPYSVALNVSLKNLEEEMNPNKPHGINIKLK